MEFLIYLLNIHDAEVCRDFFLSHRGFPLISQGKSNLNCQGTSGVFPSLIVILSVLAGSQIISGFCVLVSLFWVCSHPVWNTGDQVPEVI